MPTPMTCRPLAALLLTIGAAGALTAAVPPPSVPAATQATGPGTAQTIAPTPVKDTYPGFEMVDPYRGLENLDTPENTAWLKAQSAVAAAHLSAIPERAAIRAAIERTDRARVYNVGAITPAPNGRTFFRRRNAGATMASVYVREGESGGGRLVFDPSTMDTDGKQHTVSWFTPSPSGRRIALGIASGGSEEADFYIMDVASGEMLEGPLPRMQFGILYWESEDAMLVQRMNEQPKDAPAKEGWSNSQVYRHRVGDPLDRDVLVFGNAMANIPAQLKPNQVPGVAFHPGEQYVLAMAGEAGKLCAAWSLPVAQLGRPDAQWKLLYPIEAKTQGGDYKDGVMYTLSENSPTGEVVRFDLATGKRSVVRAAGANAIEMLSVASNGLYFRERTGVYSQLKFMHFDGTGETVIKFPRAGTVSPGGEGPLASPEFPGAVVFLDSWTRFDTDFRVDAKGVAHPTGLQPDPVGIDVEAVHSRDLTATSKDGTNIPLTLVWSGDLAPRMQRVLLRAYGSYGSTTDPYLAPQQVGVMENGIALADCHVRGGGEFGPSWHEGGRLANKHHTWEDMIACAEVLVSEGITNPKRMVAMGTSAGGMAVGNAVLARPDLFAAAVDDVGVMDPLRMLTTSRNGPAHYVEYGDVRTAEGAAIARDASAYHKITPGLASPPWLVIQGRNDPRVDAWQSAKFAARMQAASTQPVYFRMDFEAGHGMGTPADARKDLYADIAAFVVDETR